MTEEWKPDNEFLDFLLKRLEEDTSSGIDKPVFGVGAKTYTLREVVAGMSEGKEEHWRRTYDSFYFTFADDFEAYKANKP